MHSTWEAFANPRTTINYPLINIFSSEMDSLIRLSDIKNYKFLKAQ